MRGEEEEEGEEEEAGGSGSTQLTFIDKSCWLTVDHQSSFECNAAFALCIHPGIQFSLIILPLHFIC